MGNRRCVSPYEHRGQVYWTLKTCKVADRSQYFAQEGDLEFESTRLRHVTTGRYMSVLPWGNKFVYGGSRSTELSWGERKISEYRALITKMNLALQKKDRSRKKTGPRILPLIGMSSAR